MPIEIKEMIIRTNIQEGPRHHFRENTPLNSRDIQKLKKEIVQECLYELKEFLKEQGER